MLSALSSGPPHSPSPRLSPTLATALKMIERAANAGLPCPTNEAIAAHLGISSIGTASGYLSTLQKRGFIAVERGQMSRVVTILATGRRTSWEVRCQHVARLKKRAYTKRSEEARQKPLLHHVCRDPCPRCGTRADIGCRHVANRIGLEMAL